MTKQKLLIILAIAAVPGLALAQTAIRPRILTAPQAAPAATEVTPEWAKQIKVLNDRVAQLENQLNQSRQELAVLKDQYGNHTHKVPTGNLVYDSSGKIVGFKVFAGTVASSGPGYDAPGT